MLDEVLADRRTSGYHSAEHRNRGTTGETHTEVGVDRYYEYFLSALAEATARIQQRYFAVHVAGDDSSIARERAYCYELYHRLRESLDEETFPFTLHGEIDKRGHPMFGDCVGGRNPDFVVHEPGTAGPNGNLCVIAVKQAAESVDRIAADVYGLRLFRECIAYYRGILLIFGGEEQQVYCKVSSALSAGGYDPAFHSLFWHPQAGSGLLELDLSAPEGISR